MQHGQSAAELFTDLVSQADVFHGGIIVHTVGTHLYLPDVRLEMSEIYLNFGLLPWKRSSYLRFEIKR